MKDQTKKEKPQNKAISKQSIKAIVKEAVRECLVEIMVPLYTDEILPTIDNIIESKMAVFSGQGMASQQPQRSTIAETFNQRYQQNMSNSPGSAQPQQNQFANLNTPQNPYLNMLAETAQSMTAQDMRDVSSPESGM